ncbi:unnamed protein product [Caenorhabditis brenneri]
MKCMNFLIATCIFIQLVKEGTLGDDVNSKFFNFRRTTLNNFNDARRFLAGGDVRKLYDIIEPLIPKKLFNADVLGPASNMYQLKWSRELEQIGFEYMKQDSSKREKNPLATIKYKDHIGFNWMGNVFHLIKAVLGIAVPGDFTKQFEAFAEILEAIIILLWLAVAAPKTLPIKEGNLFGPAEAMFGERYEIGCFTELLYSVCFLKSLPYRDNMFKVGVPCTSCPTHCEYTSMNDGTIEEGELCIPPREPQVNYVAANMTAVNTAFTDSLGIAFSVPLILLLITYHRR